MSQIEKAIKDLIANKNWQAWAIAGTIVLVTIVLKPLLFLLALVLFIRALILAWPEIQKKF